MKAVLSLCFLSLAMISAVTSSGAARAERNADYNRNVLGVMSGGVAGTYSRLVWELSVVMEADDLRVLPVLGEGSWRNINDLLKLHKVDMAIAQLDVLDHYQSKVDDQLSEKIRYITRLHNEEVHLITRRDIESLDDLRKLDPAIINVGRERSGSHVTAQKIFRQLKMAPTFTVEEQSVALEKLRRGDAGIHALFYVAGKPATLIGNVKAGDGLHLLPLEDIRAPYVEAEFTYEDYENLVPQSRPVPTVAIPAILFAYDFSEEGARWTNVEVFRQRLGGALSTLQRGKAYHPKWSEVDLHQPIGGGWKRWGESD